MFLFSSYVDAFINLFKYAQQFYGQKGGQHACATKQMVFDIKS